MIDGIASTQSYSSLTPKNTKNQTIGNFSDILKASQSSKINGKSFLETLSDDDLTILQKEHHLADKINVAGLSEEGAENLLVADGDYTHYVDLNNDGLTEIGEAKMIIFPPPNAPECVKEGWLKTGSELTASEKFKIANSFLAKQLTANAHVMPDGRIRITKPGEPGYVNIFGSSPEAYCSIIDDMLISINKNKAYYDNPDTLIDILQEFKSNIKNTV